MRSEENLRKVFTAATALVAVTALCRFAVGEESSVPKDNLSPNIELRSVSLKDVRWAGGFWGERYEQCRRVVTPNL